MLDNSVNRCGFFHSSKKKILSLSIFLFIAHIAFSQTEKTTYKSITDSFEKNYNTNNYTAIFLSFSDHFKTAVPLGKLKNFLSNLKSKAGKINKREFIKYKKESVAVYKTNFDRAVLTLHISVDDDLNINGFAITPFKNDTIAKIKRNLSTLILPFKEEWTVLWGGDTKALNFHVIDETQKNAFDMVIQNEKGKSYKTTGQTNTDYYAFGKELIAPCDGEVVLVVTGVKDNKIGEMDDTFPSGNTVIIKTVNNEYLFFAHFKQYSIQVKQGDIVKQGQLLGRCGNSGYSTEPHLHFHIQNTEKSNSATGIKSYFNSLLVHGEIKIDYSPIKGEKIRNN